MPPKTNQQRIKDLESLADKLGKRMTARDDRIRELGDQLRELSNEVKEEVLDLNRSINEIETLMGGLQEGDEHCGGMSVDERFENHRDIIVKLQDRLDEHMFEPGAHDAPHVASLQRKAMRAQAAVRREAQKNED